MFNTVILRRFRHAAFVAQAGESFRKTRSDRDSGSRVVFESAFSFCRASDAGNHLVYRAELGAAIRRLIQQKLDFLSDVD